ncbi:MAG TPA: NRDE family protein [Chthoniobacterales bacterium]|nr:NRDE family protein [Chthoniobacterales bacterium]
MCTVSFVPTSRGFHLAMNRDEKRTRARGLPPKIVSLNATRVIQPREPNGGTWIAVNDAGICLALINWHRIERKPRGRAVSRGIVVESLAACRSLADVRARLKRLPLQQLRPFRLLAADSSAREVIEWRWNLRRLRQRKHGWAIAHWFSSGFDEREAERVRAKVCDRNGSAGSLAELRRLHRSHVPCRGPFSICMHRKDATTVSYAEVAVTQRRVTMRYADGPPCGGRRLVGKTLTL